MDRRPVLHPVSSVREVVDNLPVYMMVGIIVVIVIAQISRFAGSLLGVFFWVAVGYVGSTAYEMDGAIGIGTVRFSRTTFFGICAVLIAVNLAMAYGAYRARKRGGAAVDDDDDD